MVEIPKRLPVTLLAAALLLASSAAIAGSELTIHTGARFGETEDPLPVVGLTLDFESTPTRWFSFSWSMQQTSLETGIFQPASDALDLDVHYLEFAGVYRIEREQQAQWFVTAGVGATWATPDPSGFSDEFAFNLMVGGGAILPLGKSLGLRFDGRGYLTVSDVKLNGVCGGVGCSVTFSSGGAFQFEGLIGLSIAF